MLPRFFVEGDRAEIAAIVHRGDGLYYGIAQTPWGLAIAARRRLVSSPVPIDDERGCVLLFDAAFRHIGDIWVVPDRSGWCPGQGSA